MAYRKIRTLKSTLQRKNPHWLGCNDAVAVSWLNELKIQIFRPTANFKIFEINLYFICQPASLPAIRLGCTRCRAPEIHTIKVKAADFTKMLFQRQFRLRMRIHTA